MDCRSCLAHVAGVSVFLSQFVICATSFVTMLPLLELLAAISSCAKIATLTSLSASTREISSNMIFMCFCIIIASQHPPS